MRLAHINDNGLEQIAAALGQYHKLGRDHFTPAMLKAWASDAEDSFADGRGCEFEIRGMDTNSGAPVIVVISSEGFELEEVNDE